jgi:hypothetical protein
VTNRKSTSAKSRRYRRKRETWARRCGLPQELIREAESINGAPNLEAEEIAAIESALRAGGVEFIGGKYHGVRIKRDR